MVLGVPSKVIEIEAGLAESLTKRGYQSSDKSGVKNYQEHDRKERSARDKQVFHPEWNSKFL